MIIGKELVSKLEENRFSKVKNENQWTKGSWTVRFTKDGMEVYDDERYFNGLSCLSVLTAVLEDI